MRSGSGGRKYGDKRSHMRSQIESLFSSSVERDADFMEKGLTHAEFRKPPREREDVLLAILSLQRAEGGMELDDLVAGSLGVSLKEIKTAAKQVRAGVKVDQFLLISTAIVLEVLRLNFPVERPVWEGVVRKSADWLADIVKRGEPTVQGEALKDWARRYVGQNVRIRG